jgi:hypothetical protein
MADVHTSNNSDAGFGFRKEILASLAEEDWRKYLGYDSLYSDV